MKDIQFNQDVKLDQTCHKSGTRHGSLVAQRVYVLGV